MRARVLAATLLLCAIGCKQEKEDELTPQAVAQIKTEVTAAVDSIVAKAVRMDMEGALAIYDSSADFAIIGADGIKMNYAPYKKANMDFVAPAASIAITTKEDDCRVMTPELALCAWTGSEEVTMKTGDKMTYNPFGVTLVFKKIGGQWKVAYSHESGTVTTQKAAKK